MASETFLAVPTTQSYNGHDNLESSNYQDERSSNSRRSSLNDLYAHDLHRPSISNDLPEEMVLRELEQLIEELHVICTGNVDIDEILDKVIARVTKSMRYVRDDLDMQVICEELLSIPIIEEDPNHIRKQLLAHETTSEDSAYTVYSLLYWLCQMFPNLLRKLLHDDYLEVVRDLILQNPERRYHQIVIKLMYELSGIEEMSLHDLGLINPEFVFFLFDLVERLTNDTFENYNYDIIRLLMSLNDQFRKKNVGREVIPNQILNCLATRVSLCKTFTENILFMFNRADDRQTQLLISRFLASVFKSENTNALFYTNDIPIIIDVVIRELQTVENNDEEIQVAYLQILPPLFKNTNLSSPSTPLSPSFEVASFGKQKQKECENVLDYFRLNRSGVVKDAPRRAAEIAWEEFRKT